MKDIVSFLTDLRVNNNKVWFEANRDRYTAVNEHFKVFAERLIRGVEGFDENVKGLQVKDCTYRIYRDVRFSPDKTPYKTHMGIYISKEGKKSGYAGYYFQVASPVEGEFGGTSLIASGLHCPDKSALHSVRTEVADNFDGFKKSVKSAKGWQLDFATQMSRVPKGFDKNFEGEEFLRLKDYLLESRLGDEVLFSDQLLDHVISEFKMTKPFVTLLNKAVEFSKDAQK